MASELTATNLQKRRGVIRASVTRLEKCLRELETEPANPGVGESAKQLAAKLVTLDADFKSLHLQLVDLLNESGKEMEREQDILDKYDDDIATISITLQQLTVKSKPIDMLVPPTLL